MRHPPARASLLALLSVVMAVAALPRVADAQQQPPVPSEKRPSDVPPPPPDPEVDPRPAPEPPPAVPAQPIPPPPAAPDPQPANERLSVATWPVPAIERPLTLARGMSSVEAAILVELTSGYEGKPVALAPAAFYGLTDRVSVGIVHRLGFCLTGPEANCAQVYNDFGTDVRASVHRNAALEVVVRGGLVAQQFRDPFKLDLSLGVEGRWRTGRYALLAAAFANVGVTDANPTIVGGSLRPQLQLAPFLMIQGLIGLTGATELLFEFYDVPVGAGALYTTRRWDVGVQFNFRNLLGVNTFADLGLSHADQRELILTIVGRF
jgi:hypothetical protein